MTLGVRQSLDAFFDLITKALSRVKNSFDLADLAEKGATVDILLKVTSLLVETAGKDSEDWNHILNWLKDKEPAYREGDFGKTYLDLIKKIAENTLSALRTPTQAGPESTGN